MNFRKGKPSISDHITEISDDVGSSKNDCLPAVRGIVCFKVTSDYINMFCFLNKKRRTQ